jgi:hypothetical protein
MPTLLTDDQLSVVMDTAEPLSSSKAGPSWSTLRAACDTAGARQPNDRLRRGETNARGSRHTDVDNCSQPAERARARGTAVPNSIQLLANEVIE